ncbi:hypothetical protein [Nitrosopumilus zosterae]|nr:hypothetical protein [Nitrosopumilus zosterae]
MQKQVQGIRADSQKISLSKWWMLLQKLRLLFQRQDGKMPML